MCKLSGFRDDMLVQVARIKLMLMAYPHLLVGGVAFYGANAATYELRPFQRQPAWRILVLKNWKTLATDRPMVHRRRETHRAPSASLEKVAGPVFQWAVFWR